MMRRNILIFITIFFCSLFQSIFSVNSFARDYLDITAAAVRKIPTAVPYFIDKANPGKIDAAGRKMADLLGKGLVFHGFFTIIPAEKYQGSQQADWLSLGAEYSVLGQYEIDQSNLVLELRLIDVKQGQMILGRRYRGVVSMREKMVLKFCDEIVLTISGTKGVSLSNIAFVSDHTGHKEIFIADALGQKIKQITRHRSIAVSPRFTPDGLALTYSSYHRGNQNLYYTDLSKETTRAISWRDGLNMTPAWFPDQQELIMTLSKDGNADLYEMSGKMQPRKQLQVLRRLTSDSGINVSPAMSPDGKKIAFVSDRSGTPQIYIMNIRKKTVTRLTYYGNYNTSPSWSPDGDTIAYAGLHEGKYHIFTINADGGPPSRLTKFWDDHEDPSWSPDGRQIVFSRNRNGSQQICSVFSNGSGVRKLFDLEGNQSLPSWGPRLDF